MRSCAQSLAHPPGRNGGAPGRSLVGRAAGERDGLGPPLLDSGADPVPPPDAGESTVGSEERVEQEEAAGEL
eukprot:4663152-Alexandrium_andersonii.AAC.1